MANEVVANFTLQYIINNIRDTPSDTVRDDVDNADTAKGATPGLVNVATTGTDVSLAAVTVPGWARFKNIDLVGSTKFVTWGVWDPETGKFYRMGELGPGHVAQFKMSRRFKWEYGTGSGTIGSSTNTLRFYADGGTVPVQVMIYER